MGNEIVHGAHLMFRDIDPDLTDESAATYTQSKLVAGIIADKWAAPRGWFSPDEVLVRYPGQVPVEIAGSAQIQEYLSCRIGTKIENPQLNNVEHVTREVSAYLVRSRQSVRRSLFCHARAADPGMFTVIDYSFRLDPQRAKPTVQVEPVVRMILSVAADVPLIKIVYNKDTEHGDVIMYSVDKRNQKIEQPLFTYSPQEFRLPQAMPSFISKRLLSVFPSFNDKTAVHIITAMLSPNEQFTHAMTKDELEAVLEQAMQQ